MKRIQVNKNMSIFLTGFVQVLFISANIAFIASKSYTGAFLTSFCISLIWSYNVKRISIASKMDVFCYCLGAACGNLIGMGLIELF
jgi:hypothetical protein